MTSREMQMAFDVQLQVANPDFRVDLKPDSYTIFHYINQAQEQTVKTRYSGVNAKGESFEQTQKRTDDLRTLLTDVSISPETGVSPSLKNNSTIFILPSDYFIRVGEEVEITLNDLNGVEITKRQGVTPCVSDDYTRMLENPYSEHRLHYEDAKPLRFFYQDAVELVDDGNYECNTYFLRYMRTPIEIRIGDGSITSQDCELPEHMHQEIVNKAVSLYLGSAKDQSYESSRAELQEQE